jgi:hypothetical protein
MSKLLAVGKLEAGRRRRRRRKTRRRKIMSKINSLPASGCKRGSQMQRSM